jgi:hypothetical protein
VLGATLTFNLAHTIRSVMPDVMTAYPHAKIEVTPHGLLLSPRCRLSRRQQSIVSGQLNVYPRGWKGEGAVEAGDSHLEFA